MRDYLDFELPLKEIQMAINEASNEKDNSKVLYHQEF